jgi:hypothetical protein
MPKIAIDYSKTIIYKIVCNDLTITDLYVGSTTDFSKRKYKHKHSCNNCENKSYNVKIYKIIRDNGGWDNWAMIQIEEYPCANGNESRARERHWIEELNAKINVVIPTRTREEYIEDNKDRIKEQTKIYRDIHKEQATIYNKIYRETNPTYREENKDKINERIRRWHEKNKDEINRKKREKYEKNKDEINRKKREWREKKKLALSLKDDQV